MQTIPDSLPLVATARTTTPAARDSRQRALALSLALSAATLLGILATGETGASLLARDASLADTSRSGETKLVTMGESWDVVADGLKNDLTTAKHVLEQPGGYVEPGWRDHVKLSVTPYSIGCGPSGKELVRPFYVNSDSGKDALAGSFAWCEGACKISLQLGGDVLHQDVGMLRLRGCPAKQGYTV